MDNHIQDSFYSCDSVSGGGRCSQIWIGWGVPPAALDPFPFSGVPFLKIGTNVYRFFPEKVTHFLRFCHKTLKIFTILKIRSIVRDFCMKNGTHVYGFLSKNRLKNAARMSQDVSTLWVQCKVFCEIMA